MQFSIPVDLLDRLDIQAAVEAEVAYERPYLPESPETAAVAEHVEEMATLLSGLFRRGLDVSAGQLLQVPKRRSGLRSVTVVDFPCRVLYRALVSLVQPDLPPLDRSFERKKVLEREPIEHPGATHVVVSDVSAFYDFVDHALLGEELVSQTGEALVAEKISEFLQAVMGRDFGLPQVLQPSDVLSEAYIDIAERRLLRRQWAAWRFNDDFYLAAQSWRDANRALEALDQEIKRIGLALNEGKTLVLRADHYNDFLDRPEALWRAINDEVQIDLRAVGYDEPAIEVEVQDETVLELAAMSALEVAVQGLRREDRLEVEVNRQLANASISALRIVGSSGGLIFVGQLIGLEPQLTNRVARYLLAITGEFENELIGVYEQTLSDEGIDISAWQALWLFEPLRQVQELPEAIARWVGTYLSATQHDSVRARAALTLAEKQMIDEADLAELYGSIAPSSRADIVLALARTAAAGSPVLRGVRADARVNEWILDGVA